MEITLTIQTLSITMYPYLNSENGKVAHDNHQRAGTEWKSGGTVNSETHPGEDQMKTVV